MYDKEIHAEENNLFVCIKLKEHVYALNAGRVDSIFEIKDKITPLPHSNECILGVILLRGAILPLLDLRRLFEIESTEDERDNFVKMLKQRQDDHVRWVDQLKHSVETGETFTLATDHHKCAFGKWYDQYQSPNQTIQMRFNRIDEPHRIIHQSALECFSHDGDKQAQHGVIEGVTIPAMEKVLGYIDDMIEAFSESHRSMCVALSDGVDRIGVVVDEVFSVEELTDKKALDQMDQNRLISFVATSKTGANVLIINDDFIKDALKQMAKN